jgi:translation initiation factor 1A
LNRRRFVKKKKPAKKDGDEEITRVRLPKTDDLEMFGVVQQLMGGTQVKVACADGEERNCRIPGKLKKRVWMRTGDVVIIRLWDFQKDKADVIWRFFGNQTEWLKRNNKLEGLPI